MQTRYDYDTATITVNKRNARHPNNPPLTESVADDGRTQTTNHDERGDGRLSSPHRNGNGFLDSLEQEWQRRATQMIHPEVKRIGKISEGSILATLKFVIPRLDEPLPKMDGTGIVTVAGGKYLKYLWVQVKHVRSLSDLPIICYHLGPQEIQHPSVELLEDMGVEFRDALPLMKSEGYTLQGIRGWSAKSIAVKHCPFQNVLFLDADAIPLIDPESVFAHRDFSTGFLAFGDIAPCRKNNMLFPSIGIRYDKDFVEAEAGQFLVDKKRHWKAIQLYSFMNGRPKPFHDLAMGDKTLLQLACMKLDIPFELSLNQEWMGYGIRHSLTDGNKAFLHAMPEKRGGDVAPGWDEAFREFASLTQLQPA